MGTSEREEKNKEHVGLLREPFKAPTRREKKRRRRRRGMRKGRDKGGKEVMGSPLKDVNDFFRIILKDRRSRHNHGGTSFTCCINRIGP